MICIDARLMFYRQAGISHYTRRLVRALAATSHASNRPLIFSVLLDRRDSDTAWVPPNVNVIRTVTPAHHKYEHLTLPLELARRTPHAALLHSPDFITCRGRFRKVITVHDLYFMEHPEVMTADAARYYGRVRWSVQHADRIIAVSQFTADDIARRMPDVAHKVVVVHEAADEAADETKLRMRNAELRKAETGLLSQFSVLNSSRDPGSPKASLEAGSGQFLLFVGTLEPRKNLTTLLRAMRRLPDDVTLVVVGADGWGATDVGVLARELGVHGRVTLAGRVSDAELEALYRSARALVMPSLSEGFGLPVLEAMARGTPVVCSDSGSLPEIAGDAALVQPPMDDEQLARNVLSVWRDDGLHADLSRRGLARAAQFSWRRAAQETLAVYRAAIQNRPHRGVPQSEI